MVVLEGIQMTDTGPPTPTTHLACLALGVIVVLIGAVGAFLASQDLLAHSVGRGGFELACALMTVYIGIDLLTRSRSITS